MLISLGKVPLNFELCDSKFRRSNSLARLINSPVGDQNWAGPYRFLTNSNESSRGFSIFRVSKRSMSYTFSFFLFFSML